VIRSPRFAYVAPFCIFLGLLTLSQKLALPALAVQAGFVAVMLLVIAGIAMSAEGRRMEVSVRNWTGTLLLGVAVFAIWIAPDRLFPGYRHFWLFENPVLGKLQTSLSPEGLSQTAVLWLRGFRAVAIVPIVEELFWRGWLMRWLISSDFETVPLGTWSAQAFWIVAVLFASEHGPYWDVGLAAGALYNWWMLRTRSLGDLIVAHAVTNACLSAYVVSSGRWEYWL
jgi:CAAX prenyl protease-like protein